MKDLDVHFLNIVSININLIAYAGLLCSSNQPKNKKMVNKASSTDWMSRRSVNHKSVQTDRINSKFFQTKNSMEQSFDLIHLFFDKLIFLLLKISLVLFLYYSSCFFLVSLKN